MNTEPISFQKVLDSLVSNQKEFPKRYLREFSDLGSLELRTLLDIWPQVPLSRKLSLLDELSILSESDTLVSFDDLACALLTDPDPQVRIRAIRLLSEYEDPKVVPSYLDMLKNDPDASVRAETASALNLFVDLGELEEIPNNIHHQIEDALLMSLTGEDDVRVRRAALESLGYSSRSEVATLIESSFRREDPNWQTSALIAMGRSADERWADAVTRSLVNENENIRRAAVQAAGELSLKSTRPLLLKMLGEEEDDSVMSAVIWSLSQIGGEDVRTYLENLLDQMEDDDEQAAFVEEALDNLAFTEDLDRFELFSYEPEDKYVEIEEDEEE
jgi:HEAT repeat protein